MRKDDCGWTGSSAFFEELVRGIAVVKSFGLESWAEERFLGANAAVKEQKTRMFGKLSRLYPSVSLLNQISMTILLGYGGGWRSTTAWPLAPDWWSSRACSSSCPAQVNSVGAIADNLQQTLTGADRVYEVLDAEPEIADLPGAIPLDLTRGELSFDRVSFRFTPRDTVLQEVSLEVRPGERIAVVGPTGAGKAP